MPVALPSLIVEVIRTYLAMVSRIKKSWTRIWQLWTRKNK